MEKITDKLIIASRALLVILIAAMLNFSCEDELSLNPLTEVSSPNFYKTAADIEQAVAATYDGLQSAGQYGFNYPFYMEVRSDNTYEESLTNSGGVYGEFDIFTMQPDNPVLSQTWEDAYQCIERTNIVLNRIGGISGMSESLKDTRKGEVKFIRALTYFNIVRIWGEVPLDTTETVDPFDSFKEGRQSVDKIYEQIIKDLKDAEEALPDQQSQTGRATKGAAQTLLGKVYLTLKQWDNAIEALRSVTGYSLLPNYADIFKISQTGNEEVIFQVLFRKGINGGQEGSPYANQFTPTGASGPIGGVGQNKGSNLGSAPYLWDTYAPVDVRRDASMGVVGDFYWTKKYAGDYVGTPAENNDADANVIVLRYADVLLMLAEALNEKGYVPGGEATDLLNRVRDRSGLPEQAPGDQAAFRLAIENERKWEFAFENHRWFDLIRTDRALTVMNDNNTTPIASDPFTVSQNQLLFPVPQTEIDANPMVMTQNSGY